MEKSKSVGLIMYDTRMIVKWLNSKLHLGLTPDNILNPTAEVARDVYYNFVVQILNVPEHSLGTLPVSVDCDHDIEMHRKSIPLIILYQCMKAFIIDDSGKKLDLTMCDLVAPAKVPQRFRKLTSFLVDFMRLHEIADPLFKEVSEEFSDRKVQMEQLQQELLAEEKRKNGLLSQQSQRKRREHELINEHNIVKGQLNDIVAEYTANNAKIEEIGKQHDEALQQIDRLESEIISGKKMIEHLNGEILSSPQELADEIEKRKKQIEELRDCLKQSKASQQAMAEAIDICINAAKNVPAIVDKVNMWSAMKKEIIELQDNVHSNLRKLTDLEEELKFSTEKRNKVHERMIEQAEMQKQLREEHLQRNEMLKKNIEAITEQIIAMGKHQPNVSKEIEKKKQELLALKNIHSELVAKTMQECRELKTKYEYLFELFEETQKVSLEKRTAGERAKSRVKSALVGRLPTDYTFNTTSILEDGENLSPVTLSEQNFNVFK
ncbi:unnamed protein product [Caenorhabditis sp. 36 PRJEB53466]|nr:unnamed protein product [Caenorhabditis sp. 36 PRJEB53466]